MKTLTILILLIIAVGITNAQETDSNNKEIQTILSGEKGYGAYGAFNLGYSKIDNCNALICGMRGGIIFNNKLAIGLAGYGFVNNPDDYHYNNSIKNDSYLAGGYGGLFIEPIITGNKPVHITFPIVLGIGGVSLVEDDGDWNWYDDNYPDKLDKDLIFVFEPGVELEFNLALHFRMAASASYRFTSDIELLATDTDALYGFQFGLTFKFGKF